MRVVRDQRHTDFFRSNRSDINLALRAPVQLHAVAPRRNAVMPAKGKTGTITKITVQTCPLSNQGVTSVRTHNPAGTHPVLAEPHTVGMQAGNWSLPEQGYSRRLRTRDHAREHRRP